MKVCKIQMFLKGENFWVGKSEEDLSLPELFNDESDAILIDCTSPHLPALIQRFKDNGYSVYIHSFILLPDGITKA